MHTHMDFTGKGFIGAAEAKTSNGTRMGTVRLAVTDTWKDKTTGERKERTHWFTVTCFSDSLVTMIENGWLAKGRYVEVVGQLRDNRWTDNDNREHFEVQLVAEAVRFLDRKPGQE